MAVTIPNGFSVPRVEYPILSALGMINDHNYSGYVKAYPDLVRDSYIMKLEASGASKYTKTKVFRQWRDDEKPLPAFKVAGDVTGGGAGAAITVTLTAASHKASGTLSPVSVGQIWEDDSTGIQYEVRTVTKTVAGAHTASIAPTKASQTAAVTAASSFFKYLGRPSVKEASEQQDGIYRNWTFREVDLQMIRTNKKYSDLSILEKVESPMGEDMSYYQITKPELEEEHIYSTEFRLMHGDIMDNLTTASGNQNTNARGVIPTILEYGTDLTGSTTLDNAFFEDLTRANMGDGYTNRYEVLCETEFWIAYQNYLRTEAATTNVAINVPVSAGEQEIQAIFDFSDRVKIYGTDITLKPYAFFNSTRTHGAELGSGYWSGSAVWIPIGTYKNENAGGNLPYLRVRYMSETEGGERNMFMTDGAFVGKNTKAELEMALESWKGIEMNATKAFKYSKITG